MSISGSAFDTLKRLGRVACLMISGALNSSLQERALQERERERERERGVERQSNSNAIEGIAVLKASPGLGCRD